MFNLNTFAVAVSGLAAVAQAVVLTDLPPAPRPGKLARRYGNTTDYSTDYSCIDLQAEETFTWGAPGTNNEAVVGELKVSMPGDAENILSMERFKYLTTSISCTQTSMDISFTDDDAFEYAKGVWDWVNGADNHSFVMVAGTGDCGWNDARLPFTIFSMEYDEDANTAHLSANASTWEDSLHTFTLDIGTVATPQGLTKRAEHDGEVTIDFNHQFPVNYTTLSVPPVGVAWSCDSCGTYGEFLLSAHMETTLGIPREFTVSLQPRGVSLQMDMSLGLNVDLIKQTAKEFELFAIPLSAFVIPGGLVNIGLSIPLTLGVSLGPLRAATSIGSGLNIAIPDNATATINILDPDFQSSGWDPVVTITEPFIDARLQGFVRAYANIGPALQVKAVGTGVKLGANIGPMIQLKAEAIATTGSACEDDPEERHFGVALNPTYGVVQGIALKREIAGLSQTLISSETGLWIQQLPILCYPFGEPGVVVDSTTVSGDAPEPTQPPTAVANGAAASSAFDSMTATDSAPVETSTVSPTEEDD